MGTKTVLFKSSKGYAWNKICSFVCLKDTNEEKLEKLFFLWSSKKQICPFWRPIKIELSIFFLVIVLWSERKVFTNFQKRIFNLRSLWFFNWKLSRACKCSQICRFLGIGLKKLQKVLYHSTLLYNHSAVKSTSVRTIVCPHMDPNSSRTIDTCQTPLSFLVEPAWSQNTQARGGEFYQLRQCVSIIELSVDTNPQSGGGNIADRPWHPNCSI